MARRIDSSLLPLNKLSNLAMKVRKSDGQRHIVEHNNGSIGNELSEAANPAEIGAIALAHGIRLDEIMERGKGAPNFGQFRMVLGNRIAAIIRRQESDKALTLEQAAYPKEAAQARALARKEERLKAKATKAAKKVTKKKVGKKVTKKVGRKAGTPAKAARVPKNAKPLKPGQTRHHSGIIIDEGTGEDAPTSPEAAIA